MNSASGFLRKRRPQTDSADIALNITAMADIFTIILVFLLKSYATTAIDINPAGGLTLPSANASEANVEALKIQVVADSVLLENEVILSLKNFKFPKGDVQPSGISTSLSKSLENERKHQMAIAKLNTDVKVDPKIVVIADEKTPYSTLKTVLASAAVQGYTDFKLAVVKPQ